MDDISWRNSRVVLQSLSSPWSASPLDAIVGSRCHWEVSLDCELRVGDTKIHTCSKFPVYFTVFNLGEISMDV